MSEETNTPSPVRELNSLVSDDEGELVLVDANSLGSSVSNNNSNSSNSFSSSSTKCSACSETYNQPTLLPCLHTFCLTCLEKAHDGTDKIRCERCSYNCPLPPDGFSGLLPDYAVINILESSAIDSSALTCTACKGKDTNAVARCFDCANYLCPNCVMAHQYMHCFEGHRVLTLGELQNNREFKVERPVLCLLHCKEVKYFCRTCNTPICKECTLVDHPKGMHHYDTLCDVGQAQVEYMFRLAEEGGKRCEDLKNVQKTIELTQSKLQMQYHKAQADVAETFQFYKSMLEERRQEVLKELDAVFGGRKLTLNLQEQKVQEVRERLMQTGEFLERQMKASSNSEVLMYKNLIESQYQALMTYSPESGVQTAGELEFMSNYQAIQIGVRNTFGCIRSDTDSGLVTTTTKPQPIARPNSTQNGIIDRCYQNGHSTTTNSLDSTTTSIITKRFSSANSLGPFGNLCDLNPYEKWSSGSTENVFQNGGSDHFQLPVDALVDLSPRLNSINTIFAPKAALRRTKMIYHCKFGEFGVMEGQFTEPSGVAVNAQNDIIVADTNNHRIQIFDKEGRFKFAFGECGKRDGQLLYPNRVAVVKTSGDIVVTERSPTHQIQIYNQYGQFVRKFGANILQHPRGVTVDNKKRVIVVECKVMRVIIFDLMGNVLHKFGCSKHLEFPNGVVVNDREEIFISDNRSHSVKVFNYEGVFLRQIGGEGVTNYPIGVGINDRGEILIADNHNNFNLTIFDQEGRLLNALESKVKHAQCFDVALLQDNSVVLASKDYRLYVYRYVQVVGTQS